MKQILVIDDNSSNLQMVKSILQSKYTVTLMSSGMRAIQYLDRNKADLILLDIMMPGLDGIEVLIRLKELPETKNIPVVMLTAMADQETRQECEELGAVNMIAKPFLPSKMLDVLEEILNHTIV